MELQTCPVKNTNTKTNINCSTLGLSLSLTFDSTSSPVVKMIEGNIGWKVTCNEVERLKVTWDQVE